MAAEAGAESSRARPGAARRLASGPSVAVGVGPSAGERRAAGGGAAAAGRARRRGGRGARPRRGRAGGGGARGARSRAAAAAVVVAAAAAAAEVEGAEPSRAGGRSRAAAGGSMRAAEPRSPGKWLRPRRLPYSAPRGGLGSRGAAKLRRLLSPSSPRPRRRPRCRPGSAPRGRRDRAAGSPTPHALRGRHAVRGRRRLRPAGASPGGERGSAGLGRAPAAAGPRSGGPRCDLPRGCGAPRGGRPGAARGRRGGRLAALPGGAVLLSEQGGRCSGRGARRAPGESAGCGAPGARTKGPVLRPGGGPGIGREKTQTRSAWSPRGCRRAGAAATCWARGERLGSVFRARSRVSARRPGAVGERSWEPTRSSVSDRREYVE